MMTLNQAIGWAPLTIGELLDWPARLYPTRAAIEFNVPTTYEELRDRSVTRSNVLVDFGIRRFQRWGLLADNFTEFFTSLFALVRLGAVAAPIRHDQAAEELSQTASAAGLCGLIAAAASCPTSFDAILSFSQIF